MALNKSGKESENYEKNSRKKENVAATRIPVIAALKNNCPFLDGHFLMIASGLRQLIFMIRCIYRSANYANKI